jgi:PAS domain S-box-containing protein
MKDEDQIKEQFPEPAEILPRNVETEKPENKCPWPEKVLSVAENFYRTVFENTGTATVILEEDNTILLVNGEFERLTGYTRAEVEGRKKWTEFIARKDDLERMKEYDRLRRIDPSSVPRTYEFQFVDRKGQGKFIVVTAAIMPGRKQSLAALLDISDRKQMEAALKESERRLTDIIDFLPDATLAINLSGKVIAWNRAMEEMSGVKVEDILGKGDYEYAVPFYGMRRPVLIDLALGYDEEIERKYDFVKRKENVLLAETYVTVRGIPRTLWGKARPLYDICGNVVGAIESVRDISELIQANKALQAEISERKRAEAVLKESEEKYNQFFKTSRDCAFITSKDGRMVDLNDAAVELFGYSSHEELMQVKVPDVYAQQEDRAKHISIIAEYGYAKELPVDFKRKDGSIRHALVTSVARYDTDGNPIGFQGTIRDITERRHVEEEREMIISELESRTKNLQEVNTALNVLLQKREEDKKILEERFVANIGSLILPYVEKIRKSNLDEQQRFCLDIIKKHLDEIVSPLLKNVQQFNLTPREVQLSALIKDGRTSAEIAEILGIAKGSIDTHRKNIRKKLGLHRTSNLQSQLRLLE